MKRLISLMLAIAMVFGMLPVGEIVGLAEGNGEDKLYVDPNRSAVGKEVTIIDKDKKITNVTKPIGNLGDEISVFFLGYAGDFPSEENMAKNLGRLYEENGVVKFKVEVPEIPKGEYTIVLNKKIDKNSNESVEKQIEKLKNNDEIRLDNKFSVSHTDNLSKVRYIYNQDSGKRNEGVPGQRAQIIGSNILKPSDDLYTPPTKDGKVKYEAELVDENTIKIKYLEGKYKFDSAHYGNKEDIGILTRTIKSKIGLDVKFKTDENDKPILEIGDSIDINLPNIAIENKQIEDVELTVITEIRKKGHENNEKPDIKYTEKFNNVIDFEYEPSEVATGKLEVHPEIIPVEKVNNDDKKVVTSEDVQIGIHADDIAIYSTVKEGKYITKYPIVTIAGEDIKKGTKIDNNVVEMKILRKNKKDKWEELDGNPGNQKGEKILLTIPKGVKFDKDKAEMLGEGTKTASIQIKNPTKDINSDVVIGGEISYDLTLKEVQNKDKPKIKNIYRGERPTPEKFLIIPVTGTKGKDVKIEGTGFAIGTEVYFEGDSLEANIKESGTKLEFDMPPRRKGKGVLVIQNKNNGGTKLFKDVIYVETKDEPKLIEYGPKKLEEGTLVTLRGENFFSPDISVTSVEEQDIYSLIGSRIKIDGKDINEDNYNRDNNGNIKLKTLTDMKDLITIENDKVKIDDVYRSIILEKVNPTESDISEYAKIIYDINDREYKIEYNTKDRQILSKDSIGESSKGKIEINNIMYEIKTVYKNPRNNTIEILSNSKISGDSSQEIRFKMPKAKDAPGTIEISVQNSDFTQIDEKGMIDYKVPNPNSSKPKINRVYLSKDDIDGSNKGDFRGNYYITIEGDNFKEGDSKSGDGKTEIYIGASKIKSEDVLFINDKTLKVKIGKYQWDLEKEIKARIKEENIVAINPNGTTDSKKNGFIYIKPNNKPVISLTGRDAKGSTVGGKIIRIGTEDVDLSNDKGIKIESGTKIEDLNEEEKKVLPTIFFGSTEVEIVYIDKNYIEVKTPRIEDIVPTVKNNKVNVYLINNDYSKSNEVTFEYIRENISVDSVIPPYGNTKGYSLTNEKVSISGSGFEKSSIKINGREELKVMQLVQFGLLDDIYTSNRGSSPDDKKIYGELDSTASVELGNLNVNYKREGNKAKLSFNFEENGEVYYLKDVNFDDKQEFYNISDFKNTSEEQYKGYELIRVEVERDKDNRRRLIVERGFSPQVETITSNHLEVNVPSYHFPKDVKITVINPDKGNSSIDFEYVSPQTEPKITNILNDKGKEGEDKGDRKVVKSNYKLKRRITIKGKEFTKKAKIELVSKDSPGKKPIIIPEEDISYDNKNKDLYGSLSFNMPIIDEKDIGEYYVIVTNNDKAYSTSDGSHLEKPIYIEVTTGRSNPIVESITPNKGPSEGGTTVVIRGDDFRNDMSEYGYKGSITVRFGKGEDEKIVEDVKVISRKEIIVKTPPHKPGTVDVTVINPDDQPFIYDNAFTYVSNPKINKIVDPQNNDVIKESLSIEGGETIKIVGNDFFKKNKDSNEGQKKNLRVVFNPKLEKVTSNEQNEENSKKENIIFISGEVYRLISGDEIELENISDESKDKPKVELIDSNTIIVNETPSGKLGTGGVIVINPDNAATPIYKIDYKVPEISHPQDVRANLINDEYIRINWNKVTDKATEVDGKTVQYEVYAIEGNNRQFIGSTDTTGFVFRDIKPSTTYKFLVRAVGKYGSSKPINESMSNEVTTGRNSGPSDGDGSLGEQTSIDKTGNIANVIIGNDAFSQGNEFLIDLTRGVLAGSEKVVVSIPAKIVVNGKNKTIKIAGKDYSLKFSPNVFENSKLIANKDNMNAGVKFEVTPTNNNLELNQDTGLTILSAKYQLDARAFVASSSDNIENLNGKMNFVLDYDQNMADSRRIKTINLVKYDIYDRRFKEVFGNRSSYGTSVGDINELGTYTITGSRR